MIGWNTFYTAIYPSIYIGPKLTATCWADSFGFDAIVVYFFTVIAAELATPTFEFIWVDRMDFTTVFAGYM